MFALFFSLYYSMFLGSWTQYSITDVYNETYIGFNTLIKAVTSVFNEQFTDFGSQTTTAQLLAVVAWILALITSIGIVVFAVKGVKKAFGIFFMGINRL